MKWQPVDVIVGLLAVTVCAMLGAACVAPLMSGQPLSDERAKVVAAVVTSALSIVSMYVGAAIQRGRDQKP